MGKDVLAQARTGTGKTGAYLLPFMDAILKIKRNNNAQNNSSVKIIVLAPSKELCKQICDNIELFSTSSRDSISYVDISAAVPLPIQKSALSVNPDIVVGTPSRIIAHLAASSFSVKDSLIGLIIDEADLLLSYGYKEEVQSIVPHLPTKSYQTFITSATISMDLKDVEHLYLRNPVTITQLEDGRNNDILPPQEQLEQFKISCANDNDKYIVLVSLMKLHLLRGRTLIFANTVDRAYRLRMVFDQFGLATTILNPQLPASCRIHSLELFNSGRIDRIIASICHQKMSRNPAKAILSSQYREELTLMLLQTLLISISHQLLSNIFTESEEQQEVLTVELHCLSLMFPRTAIFLIK